MTTKVKAQKFRVRRTPRAAQSAVAQPDAEVLSPEEAIQADIRAEDDKLFDNGAADDGFGDMPYPGSAAAESSVTHLSQNPTGRKRVQGGVARTLASGTKDEEGVSGEVTPADEASIDAEIDAIRREGLSGRQLRMARRVAQKHGIAATSDFDAVRLLRKQGIDPFQRSTMLELVTTDKDASHALTTTEGAKLPKTVDNTPQLPSQNMMDRLGREDEISRIQQDIAKRRRRKMLLLAARLLVFVGIPTLLAGFYFYKIATPMYATKSAFVIQQAEAASAAGSGLSSMLKGTSFGSSQDSIAVQDYLTSRDAMLRLDSDAGFKAHFASKAIDPIQRLPENPSNEAAYKVYLDRVSIGYDPTEGLLRMEVVAADPQTSQEFSDLLVKYAEEQVDHLTQRLREDQMKGARESLADAENKMQAAQEKVVLLQEQLGIISPDAETAAIMSQISGFDTQLQQKKLSLQQLLDNPSPNQARVDGTRGDIRRLEEIIADLRKQLTEASNGAGSLARITAEQRMAEVDLATRQAMVAQAIQALEASRIEANRQVRYLSLSSRPVAPDEPTYPRKFENTLLALLVFSGIYLMASLTAAVLREQVSA
ncbi:capsule biosynthesis protein [Celeribacter persicus]|jgi:Capsule polysaccharide export protein|uniref:Capsular polysaccharide transport system permease protein n=1 Tax=Celeribacter persicus TaxID=1651082 RepID=A0A2T5H5Z4_9RHOB|nr:capsule biosynthesis protein [Celeribacter persicus]PTQ67003.1 capsular polysaccharide transport system permease protein [Celeribacter persicus]